MWSKRGRLASLVSVYVPATYHAIGIGASDSETRRESDSEHVATLKQAEQPRRSVREIRNPNF